MKLLKKNLYYISFFAAIFAVLGLSSCAKDDLNLLKDRSKCYQDAKPYPALRHSEREGIEKPSDQYEIP